MVTGGNSAGAGTVETLTISGWKTFTPSLPVSINSHCMAMINTTTVIVVAGLQTSVASGATYILNNDYRVWASGPNLNQVRYFHQCGKLLSSPTSQTFGILSVGGLASSTSILGTSEFLGPDLSGWSFVQPLPVPTHRLRLIEDPYGGVFVIGGYTSTGLVIKTLLFQKKRK
jgi:hypothetical protein